MARYLRAPNPIRYNWNKLLNNDALHSVLREGANVCVIFTAQGSARLHYSRAFTIQGTVQCMTSLFTCLHYSRYSAVHDFTIHVPSLFTCLHCSRHRAVHDFTIHVPSLFTAQCSACLHCSRHSAVMQCMPSLFTAQCSAYLHCSQHSARACQFSIHATEPIFCTKIITVSTNFYIKKTAQAMLTGIGDCCTLGVGGSYSSINRIIASIVAYSLINFRVFTFINGRNRI